MPKRWYHRCFWQLSFLALLRSFKILNFNRFIENILLIWAGRILVADHTIFLSHVSLVTIHIKMIAIMLVIRLINCLWIQFLLPQLLWAFVIIKKWLFLQLQKLIRLWLNLIGSQLKLLTRLFQGTVTWLFQGTITSQRGIIAKRVVLYNLNITLI